LVYIILFSIPDSVIFTPYAFHKKSAFLKKIKNALFFLLFKSTGLRCPCERLPTGSAQKLLKKFHQNFNKKSRFARF